VCASPLVRLLFFRHNVVMKVGFSKKVFSKIGRWWKTIDRSLDKELLLLGLLLLLITLRLPNFFEPYWYGDEAIYLTIGNALSTGSRLYVDIVDHKTPLIYYLAMVPSQVWFRILLLGWMIGATVAFYHLALRLYSKIWVSTIATAVFVLLTTLPWFEGNIPNGELFVMGFILVGGLALLYTRFYASLVDPTRERLRSISKEHQPIQSAVSDFLHQTNDQVLYVLAGVLFGAAILTKVPALFDVAAFLTIGWFSLTNSLTLKNFRAGQWQKMLVQTGLRMMAIGATVVGMIAVSILYFASRGSLAAYLDFGLLYNFHYVQTWVPSFLQAWLSTVYTLPVKFGLATSVVLLLTVARAWLRPRFQFIAAWFTLALFASLLSNRPYPHYFLQVVPPLALLIGEVIRTSKLERLTKKSAWVTPAKVRQLIATLSVSAILLFTFSGVLTSLKVGLYPTLPYYQRTLAYLRGQIDEETYRQGFNGRMRDNYQAAELIIASSEAQLFIWGTNPELYALTKKVPVGRFTVSFHIKDLKVYDETMAAVNAAKPHFIVVMKNESEPLPGLDELLQSEYLLNSNFEHFELWKRTPVLAAARTSTAPVPLDQPQ